MDYESFESDFERYFEMCRRSGGFECFIVKKCSCFSCFLANEWWCLLGGAGVYFSDDSAEPFVVIDDGFYPFFAVHF